MERPDYSRGFGTPGKSRCFPYRWKGICQAAGIDKGERYFRSSCERLGKLRVATAA